jgi:hypothetical protein
MPRKHASVAPDGSSAATILRIYDPDGLYGKRTAGVEPEVAEFQVAGYPCYLLDWTAEEWARLSGDERPGDAFQGSRGSWYRFDPPADGRD